MSTRTPKVGWTGNTGLPPVVKIGPQAANDSRPNEPDLRAVVERARLLLDAAGRRGFVVAPSVVEAIIAIERQIEIGMPPDAPILTQFVRAYDALWKIAGGVSS